MELIRYLDLYFFTREQLLARCGIDGAALEDMQRRRTMPLPSYRLRLEIGCDSFFGAHLEHVAADYYAKGCASWFSTAAAMDEQAACATFVERYKAHLAQLGASGIAPRDPGFANKEHLQAEWKGFLDGTYGLCTVSGLPEDVAAKEAAIAVIREVTEAGRVDGEARELLRKAVDLLDSASAPFAPHEVARSSRRRYVDEMRAAYQL
jgi:hypothetical protein